MVQGTPIELRKGMQGNPPRVVETAEGFQGVAPPAHSVLVIDNPMDSKQPLVTLGADKKQK